MKQLLLVLLLIPFMSYCQDEVSSTYKDFEMTKAIKFSQTKNIAYLNSLIWIAETFGDANEAIKLKDKEEGVIVVKSITDYGGFDTNFTMTLMFNNEECLVSYKKFKNEYYGYNTNGWGIKPNACYTKSCKKNYSKWYSSLEAIVEMINSSLTKEIN